MNFQAVSPVHLLILPSELLVEIIFFIDVKQILEFGRTCKYVRDGISKHDELIWKKRLHQHLPNWKLNTIADYTKEFHLDVSVLYAISWKCIYFYLQNSEGIFTFNPKDAKKDVFISEDGRRALTGKEPASEKMRSGEFRIHLLEPGIPRKSTRVHKVHVQIIQFGVGLWLGISRKNFKTHTWLGDEEDSWGWGNRCRDFCWNYKNIHTTWPSENLGLFGTGDVVTMIADMKNRTFQYLKNGEEGKILEIDKIPEDDDLHFAVGLFGYTDWMEVTLLPTYKPELHVVPNAST